MPYRDVERGDIIVFHHPDPPLLVKRVVGVPGDHLRIEDGRVFVNGTALNEPYAAFEPAPPNPFRDNFPAQIYTDPQVDPEWWMQMQSLTQNGELVVPAGRVFCARRQSQSQQGFALLGICAAAGDCGAAAGDLLLAQAAFDHRCAADSIAAGDDRLGHDRLIPAKLTGFARWKRIFHVVH